MKIKQLDDLRDRSMKINLHQHRNAADQDAKNSGSRGTPKVEIAE